ncbi:MAG: DUF2784 domain-containing protein [Bacteroidales bacterium]|nr:DUF2784 domain-containing protein [Bacteroidales bacterium]
MLKFLDIFFLSFHTLLIFFNLFGWICKKTRKINLITLSLTGASWFILGIFYGIGYCPLTDWHWTVVRKLGKTNIPNSYIKYLFDRLTGLDINSTLVDYLTAICFFIALVVSVYVNFKDYFHKKSNEI